MLATLAEIADHDDMIYEIKWDGYRAIAMCNRSRVKLLSRNQKSFEQQFYPVYSALLQWNINAIVDGEIIAMDGKGETSFTTLQNWRKESDGELLYYVFDLMWWDGYDLTGVALTERRKLLKKLIPGESSIIRMSETIEADPDDLLDAVRKIGMEGIMAKKSDSLYYPGLRTKEWLKIKAGNRHEVVIGGYTQNEGTGKSFSALLVGIYKNNKLHYLGKVGTGFSVRSQKEILQKMKPLVRKTNPFSASIDVNKPSRFRQAPLHAKVTWLKPELVAEVSYTELTADRIMRHPSFKGLREDKRAIQVVEEKQITVSTKKKTNVMKAQQKPGKEFLSKTQETQTKVVSKRELTFSNTQKLFWPKEKITKGDLISYYHEIAADILPYLKGRPESLNRYPDGWEGKSFYQKDVKGKVPKWVTTFPYRSVEENTDKEFFVADDEASLLYMVNLGCIEIHPWNSTNDQPEHPTWCVLDLDPDNNKLDSVVEAARIGFDILTAAKIPAYCKTSGSTGLHIYIPLHGKYTYDQSKEFARIIVTLMHQELPKLTSIERSTTKRKGKIYLDFLQNRPQATLAAPYSVRPKPGATVSMPLYWDEVKKGLKMKDFHLQNAIPIIKERSDLFKGVLGKGIDLSGALKALKNVFGSGKQL